MPNSVQFTRLIPHLKDIHLEPREIIGFICSKPAWIIFLLPVMLWFWLVIQLDPTGNYPHLMTGPGLTIDETFNVQQGVFLIEAISEYGWGLLDPESLREVFVTYHLPDHPPLGRLWLGIHHHLFWWLLPPELPEGPFCTTCARSGSATAFALTVAICGWYSRRWHGLLASVLTMVCLGTMPRMYGHAHLAALESCLALGWTTVSLVTAEYWSQDHPPPLRKAALSGCLLGLLLLIKIQGFLLFLPIVVVTLIHHKHQAILPLVIWGTTSLLIFLLGWPWLWFDFPNHVWQFLGSATERASIAVFYSHQIFHDRTVPRIYVLGTFLVTTPALTLSLGLWGIWQLGKECIRRKPIIPWREIMLGGIMLFPFVLFTLPGVPVYDGDRLWGPLVWPLWCIWSGRGGSALLASAWISRRWWLQGGAVVSMSAYGLWGMYQMHPVYLSYYNELVGGVRGAVQRGWEANYWSDALSRDLLQQAIHAVQHGDLLALAPVLHQFQLEELRRQSPIIRSRRVRLVPYDPHLRSPHVLIVFRRRADLPPELTLESLDNRYRPISVLERQGTWLAAVYRTIDHPAEGEAQ